MNSCLKWILGAIAVLFVLGCLVFGSLTLVGMAVGPEGVPSTADAPSTAGGQSAEQAPGAVSLGAEHTNPVGIAFQPPAGWQVEEENDLDNGIASVQLLPPNTTRQSTEVTFRLFLVPIEVLALTLDEFTLDAVAEYTKAQFEQNFASAIPNAEISMGEPRRITIGGEEAVVLDLSGTVQGRELGGRIVAAMVNNRQQYFQTILFSPAAEWQDGAVADAVLGTVRFTGGAGQ